MDIVHILRPRHPRDDDDVAIDPAKVASGKQPSELTIPKRGLPYPTRQEDQRKEQLGTSGSNVLNSLVLESIPRAEVSPVQLIFSGATLPDGRANTVGQRVFQRYVFAASITRSQIFLRFGLSDQVAKCRFSVESFRPSCRDGWQP